MGVFEQLPYTNFHDLNLDWIIKRLKTLEDPTTEADRAEAAANAAEISAGNAADDAAAAAATLAAVESAITRAAEPAAIVPETVTGITEYQAGYIGHRLFKCFNTVIGEIQLHIIGEVAVHDLLASGFPSPAGGAYTIIGHHTTSAKLGEVVFAHLSRSADQTYPTENALYLLAGSVEQGDRIVFDMNYCTR